MRQRTKPASSAQEKIQEGKSSSTGGGGTGKFPQNVTSMRHVSIQAFKFDSQDRNGKGNQTFLGSVRLPAPIEIQTQHNAQWNQESLTQPTDTGQGVGGGLSAGWQGMKRIVGGGQQAVADSLKVGQDANIRSGSTMNPNLELSYTQHGLRQFQFTYAFVPRNEYEAKEIQKIKKFFQMYSHAYKKEASDVVRIEFPSTFRVSFNESSGSPIQSVTQPLPCHVTDLSIIDNPHGYSSWLKDSEGNSYPSMTSINITFQEYRMRLRDDF